MMLRKLVLIGLLVSTFGCGSDRSPGNSSVSQPQTENPDPAPASGLRGKWRFADVAQTVIDFSALDVEEERPSEEILATCDTQAWENKTRKYTNSGVSPMSTLPDLNPGVQQGVYKIMGGEQLGVLQFGYLKNSGFSNDICRILSGERYSFTVSDDALTLAIVAPGKPYDGSSMTLTRE